MDKKITKPSHKDEQKCIRLRCDSKRGTRLHPEDSAFCQKMFKEHREWYSKTEKDIFNMTKPFGA